jgi:hypothetical protein
MSYTRDFKGCQIDVSPRAPGRVGVRVRCPQVDGPHAGVAGKVLPVPWHAHAGAAVKAAKDAINARIRQWKHRHGRR